jgi:outer membrane immunogenic protein
VLKNLLLAATATAALTGSAFAADLPRRAAPPVFTPVAPVFTWTGFFIGTESTYLFTDRQRVTTTGLDATAANALSLGNRPGVGSTKVDGFGRIGGGIGYNYQFTPGSGFVAGVAANVDWTDLEKRKGYVGANGAPTVFRQDLEYLGTVTGRLGYAFDRFLVYGTGGFGFGGVDYRTGFYNAAFAPLYAGRRNGTETGFVYGGGIEYAIPADSFLARFNLLNFIGIQSAAVTLKAEYLHYDLGHRDVVAAPISAAAGSAGYVSRFRTEGNIIRAGVNYKFNSFLGL